MSNAVPCCLGCLHWGHARGCYCIPPEKREVTVPAAKLARLLAGTASERDKAILKAAADLELR